MTGGEFARERGLSASSLYWWSSELNRRGEVGMSEPDEAFVAVRVVDEGPEEAEDRVSAPIELVTTTGRVIRVYGAVDSEDLAVVLEVAERC